METRQLSNEQLAIALLMNDKNNARIYKEKRELQDEFNHRLETGQIKFWEDNDNERTTNDNQQ